MAGSTQLRGQLLHAIVVDVDQHGGGAPPGECPCGGRAGLMKILGFNRVELMVPADEIDDAVAKFNDTFGFALAPAHKVAGQDVLSTVDFAAGIEFMAPSGPDSPLAPRLAKKGRGGIGPLVWEVDDIDAAREHLIAKGASIYFEYEGEGIRQICLDPDEFFGYVITFMQRTAKS